MTSGVNEWLDEGLRQLCVAGSWYAYLEGPTALPDSAADELRGKILEPFLQLSWWPIKVSLETLKGGFETAGGARWLDPFPNTFRRHFAALAVGQADDWTRQFPKSAKDVRQKIAVTLGDAIKGAFQEVRQGNAAAAADGNVLPLPPLVDAEKAVQIWSQQARAVVAWQQLAARADTALGGARPVAAPSDLADECCALRERLEKRNADAVLAKWFRPRAYDDYQLIAQAIDVLGRCEARLRDTAVGTRAGAAAVDGFLSRESASWPPLWLARREARRPGFLDALRGSDLKEALARLKGHFPKAEPTVLARLLLAEGAVDALDRAEGPDAAWDDESTAAVRVLFADSPLDARVVRDPGDGLPAWFDKPLTRDGVAEPRTVRSGLVVAERDGAPGIPLRLAQVEQAPQRAPWLQALTRLAAWLRRGGGDGTLAESAAELLGALQGTTNLAAWWGQADAADRGLVWRVLQRTATLLLDPAPADAPAGSPPTELLDTFAREGFTFGVPPPGEATEEGPWFLAAGSPNAAGATRTGPALRGPDGTWVGPTVWLLTAAAQKPARPLAACLARPEVKALLDAARREVGPSWDGWITYNTLLEELPRLPPDAPLAAESPIACGILRVITQGWALHQARGQGSALRALAEALQRHVSIKLDLLPRFDPETMRPEPPPADAKVSVEWTIDKSQEHGTFVEWPRFTAPGEKGKWRVVRAATLPEDLAPWWDLPAPPPGPRSDGPALACAALADWHAEVQRLKWRPGDAAAAAAKRRDDFGRWLATKDGLAWFDAFARLAQREAAHKEPTHAGLDWLQALRRAEWCDCFPRLDPQTGALAWPEGQTGGSEVQREFAAAPRNSVTKLTRFAPTAARAACVVSLGPARPGGPVETAGRIVALTRGLGKAEATGPILEKLQEASRRAEVTGHPVADADRHAWALLDALAHSDAADGVKNDLWAAVAAWCRTQGLRPLPSDWRFGAAPPGGSWPEDEIAEPECRFSDRERGAALGVARFGLARAGQEPERARLVLSAGPAPEGFADLEQAVSGRGGEAIRAELAKWPTMRTQEPKAFAVHLVDFFNTYYDELRTRLADEERALRVDEALERLLRAEAGLEQFRPSSVQQFQHGGDSYENWIDVRFVRGVMTTGNVARVRKPGLLTRATGLAVCKVRAVADVE